MGGLRYQMGWRKGIEGHSRDEWMKDGEMGNEEIRNEIG